MRKSPAALFAAAMMACLSIAAPAFASIEITTVPEPATAGLFGLAAVGIAVLRQRRRRKANKRD